MVKGKDSRLGFFTKEENYLNFKLVISLDNKIIFLFSFLVICLTQF